MLYTSVLLGTASAIIVDIRQDLKLNAIEVAFAYFKDLFERFLSEITGGKAENGFSA